MSDLRAWRRYANGTVLKVCYDPTTLTPAYSALGPAYRTELIGPDGMILDEGWGYRHPGGPPAILHQAARDLAILGPIEDEWAQGRPEPIRRTPKVAALKPPSIGPPDASLPLDLIMV